MVNLFDNMLLSLVIRPCDLSGQPPVRTRSLFRLWLGNAYTCQTGLGTACNQQPAK